MWQISNSQNMVKIMYEFAILLKKKVNEQLKSADCVHRSENFEKYFNVCKETNFDRKCTNVWSCTVCAGSPCIHFLV